MECGSLFIFMFSFSCLKSNVDSPWNWDWWGICGYFPVSHQLLASL